MNELLGLLKNGANPNAKDHKGFTLLMSFAEKNDVESVRLLLSYGAISNMKDFLGFTAVDYAIMADALEVIQVLMQNGTVITNDNYMLAVRKNNKRIVDYFDTLDENKEIFLKKKR